MAAVAERLPHAVRNRQYLGRSGLWASGQKQVEMCRLSAV